MSLVEVTVWSQRNSNRHPVLAETRNRPLLDPPPDHRTSGVLHVEIASRQEITYAHVDGPGEQTLTWGRVELGRRLW
jgi:hypothetical protein